MISQVTYLINNIYHRTIKVKPIDVKSGTYMGFDVKNNDKDLKFKFGDHVRISKYKDIFTKCYSPNWLSVPWRYVIFYLNYK